MAHRLLALAALTAFCAAAPVWAYDRLPGALAGRSPADFAEEVRIVDDPRAPTIVLSTRDAYTRARPLAGAVADDVHLRALIDRSTGAVTWQVWHDLVYVGGRRDVGTVHYRAGGADHAVRPIHLEHRPDRCPPTDGLGHCSETLRIGFELPEAAVREIAGAYAPGSRSPWRLRFKDAGGRDVTGGLAPAEAAGILRAVEDWRRRS